MQITRIITVLLLLLTSWKNSEAKPRLLVFAAASMKNALESIGLEFENRCDCKVVFSFAGSGLLARQIDAGAPADVFISADLRWMQWLLARGIGSEKNITIVAGNRMVVVSAKENGSYDNNNLETLLADGRISIAEPNSVPAGRYAKQALKKLGLWQGVQQRLVFGENVRVALRQVARGDVSAAIVYHSDAQIEERVGVSFVFPADLHETIVYPSVLLRPNNLSKDFFAYLGSDQVQKIFRNYGFSPSIATAKDGQPSD